MWEHGNDLTLGNDMTGAPIRLSADQRSFHMWTPGLTGAGKTTFLEGLICQDIESWTRTECGLCVIDPDGSLYENVMAWAAHVDPWMRRPIVPIDLTQEASVIAFNVLRSGRDAADDTVAQNVTSALAHTMGQADTSATPRFARIMESIASALMRGKLALPDAIEVLSNKSLRERLASLLDDQPMHAESLSRLGRQGSHDESESTLNRLFRLLRNPRIRRILGVPTQDGQSLDFGRAIDDGAIVLVNLGIKGGLIQPDDAKVFGSLILSDLWTAMLVRGKANARSRPKPFYLYIDELADFGGQPVLMQMLQRGRGYGLHMTLANQYPNQLKQPGDTPNRLLDAMKAGCRNKVVFSLSDHDDLKNTAEMLFSDTFDPGAVKNAIHATKVLSYREEMRKSVSRGSTRASAYSESDASSESESESDSYGDSDGLSLSQGAFPEEHAGWFGFGADRKRITLDNVGELEDAQQELAAQVNRSRGASRNKASARGFSQSSSSSQSHSESNSESETLTPTLIPVLGTELSSLTYESLDEQLHKSMMLIKRLPNLHAWVRLVNEPKAHFLPVARLAPGSTDEEEIFEFTARKLAGLTFAFSREEAEEMILAGSGVSDRRAVRAEEPANFAVPVDLVEPLDAEVSVVKAPRRKAVKK
jgi:hypothetical protein